MVIFPPNSLKQWFTSHCENRGWSFLSTQIIKICGLIQPLLNHTNCEQTSLESLFKRRRYFNSDSLESWVGFTSSSTVVITTQQFIIVHLRLQDGVPEKGRVAAGTVRWFSFATHLLPVRGPNMVLFFLLLRKLQFQTVGKEGFCPHFSDTPYDINDIYISIYRYDVWPYMINLSILIYIYIIIYPYVKCIRGLSVHPNELRAISPGAKSHFTSSTSSCWEPQDSLDRREWYRQYWYVLIYYT